MIKLYQFDPAFGLPNASPFCMKLETWLRMAGLPFEAPLGTLHNLQRAPLGKLPYIVDQGVAIADSGFIIEHLTTEYAVKLDAWLDASQRATALAWQRLLEEHLYWAVVHTRWVQDAGWALTREAFFGQLPVPLKWVVPTVARRGLIRQLRGHGMGLHAEPQIIALGQADITALADFLGDKRYFMGSEPCSLDACAYAFLANLLWAPVESELKRHAQRFPQLQAYCERMRGSYYA